MVLLSLSSEEMKLNQIYSLSVDVLNGNAAYQLLPPVYEFIDPHLLEYSVRAKNMHLVDSSEGIPS